VRSRTSSFSARSGGTKGKAGGKGIPAPSPYGGRSKTLSNLQQIKNAINLVCLAGGHFDVQRLEAVRAIETYSAGEDHGPVTQMLVLVTSSKSPSFKALYAVHPTDGRSPPPPTAAALSPPFSATSLHFVKIIIYLLFCFTYSHLFCPFFYCRSFHSLPSTATFFPSPTTG
jgi:Microtubule-binding calmodulin-regulated spectrin-associated